MQLTVKQTGLCPMKKKKNFRGLSPIIFYGYQKITSFYFLSFFYPSLNLAISTKGKYPSFCSTVCGMLFYKLQKLTVIVHGLAIDGRMIYCIIVKITWFYRERDVTVPIES